MRSPMLSICIVTVYLLVYAAMATFGDSYDLAMLMFIFSPFLVIWMVYNVLKYGKHSGKTFNEYFYEDNEYRKVSDND